MTLPDLYLGSQLVVSGDNAAFNNASVTVKAPVSDLNVANKLYVDVADNSLNLLISTETSNRISEDAKIIASSCRSVIVPLTTAIIGGQAFPTVMPSSISELGYDGWYYNKTLNDTVNRKINWYFTPDVNMTVADLYQIYFEMNLIKPNKIPFMTVYTKPTGTGDAASWFKSSRTFEVLNTTLNANTGYCCYYNFDAKAVTPVSFNHTAQTMSQTDVVANIRGPFASSEQVLAFSFGTDSSAGVGTVEFICRSVSVQSAKGTVNFLLSNIHVESKALSAQVNNMYQYFFKQNRDGPAIV